MNAVIVDMDGTLCDVSSIRHYVTGNDRNFDKFHKASLWCPPTPWVAEEVSKFSRDPEWVVIIVTARDARYERETRDWLVKHGIQFDHIYMRGWGDIRPDYIVKQEILDNMREDGYEPLIAFDDNPEVVEVWRRNGIAVRVVPGWP